MKAYFRERGTKYHIRFVDRNNADHKEFVESFDKQTTSKADVKSKIDHINHKIKFQDYDPWEEREQKKYKKRLSYPLGKAVMSFINENIQAGNWLPQTKKGYESRLKLMVDEFGELTILNRLSEKRLQHWLTNRDISPITKQSYSREYNYFFKWLYQNELTPTQWKIGVTNIEQQEIQNTDKIKYIIWQELKDMERGYRWQIAANNRAGFVQDSYYTGKHPDAWWFMFWQVLRRTELPKITPKDIKGNKVRIHGKGNKVDWIYMVPPAQKIAQRRLKVSKRGQATVRYFSPINAVQELS